MQEAMRESAKCLLWWTDCRFTYRRVGVLGPPPRPPPFFAGEGCGRPRFEWSSGGPGLESEPRLETGSVVAVAEASRLDAVDDVRLGVRVDDAAAAGGGSLFSSSMAASASSSSSSSSSASPHLLGVTGRPAIACLRMSLEFAVFAFLLSRGGVMVPEGSAEATASAAVVASSMSIFDDEAAAGVVEPVFSYSSSSAFPLDDRCGRFLLLRAGGASGEAAAGATT